jgi:RNA polymerase sigma-70 factor, ECF subfamily
MWRPVLVPRRQLRILIQSRVTLMGTHMLEPTTHEPAGWDEQAILARLQRGDEEAFELVVRTFSGRLLMVARRILGSDDDARDALQSTFLSAFRSLTSFEGEARLSTWLHRIVVNTSLMKLRGRRRKPEAPIEELLPRFLEDGHHADPDWSWSASAEDLLTRKETHACVRAAIARLPESYRTVVMLRDIEELSTAEVAAALGVSENAVKLRLHRARQALATILRSDFRAMERRRP